MAGAGAAQQAFSEERLVDAGRGIQLCYQALGDPEAAPMVLAAGIGAQMLTWSDGFCELLAARGYRVIRFDNRDCGRSTWLTDLGTPSVTKAFRKEVDDPPYLLSDMAADIAGLMDGLGIDSAHVLGSSLGGFVAQTLAIEHPSRMRSLASMMSSTGSGRVGQPTPAAMEVLMTRPPAGLDAYLVGALAARRVIGSVALGLDEEWLRETWTRAYERGINPDGTQRQLVASICSGDRTERLRGLRLPTVVLHGKADPLIDVSGGIATAEAIPGAELVLIDGWGHDLPRAVWERVVDAVDANARRAAVG